MHSQALTSFVSLRLISINAVPFLTFSVSMASYLTAILPNLLSKRTKVVPGYFWMGGPIGFIVNGVSSLFMMAFIVIFCFPVSAGPSSASFHANESQFAKPVDAETMSEWHQASPREDVQQLIETDYTCVIFGGLTIIMSAFYLLLRGKYEGPRVIMLGKNIEMTAQEYRNSIAA